MYFKEVLSTFIICLSLNKDETEFRRKSTCAVYYYSYTDIGVEVLIPKYTFITGYVSDTYQ